MPILKDPKPMSPSKYVEWCGPHLALVNFKCMIGQSDPGFFIPAWWIEVKNLCEKALGGVRLSIKDLHAMMEANKKQREALKNASRQISAENDKNEAEFKEAQLLSEAAVGVSNA